MSKLCTDINMQYIGRMVPYRAICSHLSSSNTCSIWFSPRWFRWDNKTNKQTKNCSHARTHRHTHTHVLIRSCRLQYPNNLVVSFGEIDMQIKWICSSVLLRDFLKSNPRGNFEPLKYECDNMVCVYVGVLGGGRKEDLARVQRFGTWAAHLKKMGKDKNRLRT